MARQIFEKLSLLDEQDLDKMNGYVRESIELATGRRMEDLESYHISHSQFHSVMSRKSNREFREAIVLDILKMPSIQKLQERFEGYSVGCVVDEDGVGDRPEIYFRLVRPHTTEDVGCPHMDTRGSIALRDSHTAQEQRSKYGSRFAWNLD